MSSVFSEIGASRARPAASLFIFIIVFACIFFSANALAADGKRGLVFDPSGDTFGNSTLIDIDRFAAVVDDDELEITMSFFGPITPADEDMPNSVSGVIEIDIDQDLNTGNKSIVDDFCPGDPELGVEFYVDMDSFDGATGLTDLFDGNGTFVDQVDADFTEDSFTVSIPLSLLDEDDGIANLAAVMGTTTEATDCAPNSGFIISHIPGFVINVSTNAFIVDITGFVVGFIVEDGSVRVAMTGESNPALGPPIDDAFIELINIFTGDTIETNDDCSDDLVAEAEVEQIIGRELGSESDACLVMTLDAGLYGLRLRDSSGGSGYGLAGATGAVEE